MSVPLYLLCVWISASPAVSAEDYASGYNTLNTMDLLYGHAQYDTHQNIKTH